MGFVGVQDRQKVEGFFRRSTRAGFCSKDLPNFSDICLEADQNLFRKVLHNPEHCVASTSPPVSASTHSYSLRTRAHNRQLPDRLSRLVQLQFCHTHAVLSVILTLMSFYIQFYREWCKLCFVCFNACVPVYFYGVTCDNGDEIVVIFLTAY